VKSSWRCLMGIVGPAVEAGRSHDVLVNPIEDGEDWG
jgi:hypothetical protein